MKFTSCSLTALQIRLDRIEVRLINQKFSGRCKEPILLCGTIIGYFHRGGKVVRDMESESRFEMNRGRSAPTVRNRTGGIPSGPDMWIT